MKKISSGLALMLALVILPSLTLATPADIDPQGQTVVCPSLRYNLRYQLRDASTNGEISSLQDFLQLQGYLNSEPTGYFGLQTFKAVKNFQSANGIQPTGYVGVLTRAKIASSSNCGVASISYTGNNQVPTLKVISPNGGQTITKGDMIKIEWDYFPNPATNFAIILKNGGTMDNVAQIRYCDSSKYYQEGNRYSFDWKAGYDAKGVEIPNGNYKVLIYNCGNTQDVSDSSFTIVSANTQANKPVITRTSVYGGGNFEAYSNGIFSIEGSYLAGNYTYTTYVYIGGVQATVTEMGNNYIKVKTPNLSSGIYDLTISNEKGISNPVKLAVVDGYATSKSAVKTYYDPNILFDYPANYMMNEVIGTGIKGGEGKINVSNGYLHFNVVSNIKFDYNTIGIGDYTAWEAYRTETIGNHVVTYLRSKNSPQSGVRVLAVKEGAPYYLWATASEANVVTEEFKTALQTILLSLTVR